MLYDYKTCLEEPLMQALHDDDRHRGQRSSRVKCGKLCAMSTKLLSGESLLQV